MKISTRIKSSTDLMLVIDCNGICHAVKHTMGQLTHNGDGTGIIFGFLSQLLFLQKRLKPNRIVFAWDSRQSKRRELDPRYKAHRKTEKTEEDLEKDKLAYRQFELLRKKILPNLGFKSVFHQLGYEADDLIASAVYNNAGKKVIISRDQDLYQLLSDDCSMYDPQSKKFTTKTDFIQEYGIQPIQWIQVKATAGCPGDGVVGIKGIGEKSVAQHFRGELKGKKAELLSQEGAKYLAQNRPLVALPFVGTNPVYAEGPDLLSWQRFVDVCGLLGFSSFIQEDKKKEWKEAFKWRNSHTGRL